MIGITKAKVLPDPVTASAATSLRFRNRGIAAAFGMKEMDSFLNKNPNI